MHLSNPILVFIGFSNRAVDRVFRMPADGKESIPRKEEVTELAPSNPAARDVTYVTGPAPLFEISMCVVGAAIT